MVVKGIRVSKIVLALAVLLALPAGAVNAAEEMPPSFAALVQKAAPAVVNIMAIKSIKAPAEEQAPRDPDNRFNDFFDHFFGDGMPRQFRQGSLGSGFIIGAEGLILTNNHVIEDASEITVKLADDRRFKAEIVGRDPKTDLALIRIKAGNALTVLPLGDSDAMEVGDWVVAIGNPFGLGNTVTSGIVSAKYRTIGSGTYDNFIQTDTPINPGNSGGPLLNMQGKVIGINSAIFSQSGGNVGIGFALPINMVQELLPQLREGRVRRSYLGVMIQDVTPALEEVLNLGTNSGALVSDVVAGGPGFKAGVLRGDVIVSFDGKKVSSAQQLPMAVASTPIGKKVVVEIIRKGKKMSLQAYTEELEEEGQPPEPEVEDVSPGLSLQALTPELALTYDLERIQGLLIVDVEQASPAAEAGLEPGDIIVEADQQPMGEVAALKRIISRRCKGDTLLLLVDHGGRTVFVTLILP